MDCLEDMHFLEVQDCLEDLDIVGKTCSCWKTWRCWKTLILAPLETLDMEDTGKSEYQKLIHWRQWKVQILSLLMED